VDPLSLIWPMVSRDGVAKQSMSSYSIGSAATRNCMTPTSMADHET